MKIEKWVYSDQEKRVLSSMLLDTGVLAQYAPHWPRDNMLFASNEANQIAKRLKRYYQKHRKAPGTGSVYLLNEILEQKNNQEILERYVGELEEVLNRQEQRNPPTHHSLDLCKRHFDSVVAIRIEQAIQNGKDKHGNVLPETIDKVEELGKRRIEVGGSSDVFNLSEEVLDRPREDENRRAIVEYPDDLGIWMGDAFHRTAFVAFLGSSKSGKSYFLMDLAFRALQQERNVVCYELGDLGRRDHQIYLEQRISCRPIKKKYQTHLVPNIIDLGKGGEGAVRGKTKTYNLMDAEIIKRKIKRYGLQMERLRSRYYSSTSFSAELLRNDLENKELDGWRPDVVIIDYADLLVSSMDPDRQRVETNATWKELRNIAHRFDCVVATATQTKAEGYGKGGKVFLLGPEHFSDSRTKNDHVTAMIGINKTDEEESQGVRRLNWIENRHDKRGGQVYVAGVYAWGNPIMLSRLP